MLCAEWDEVLSVEVYKTMALEANADKVKVMVRGGEKKLCLRSV